MRIFVAEWMKTRHTILHRLVLLIPLFCSLAVLGYAAYRKKQFFAGLFLPGIFSYMVGGASPIRCGNFDRYSGS